MNAHPDGAKVAAPHESRAWSEINLQTRVFTGRRFACREADARAMVRAGCGVFPGAFDSTWGVSRDGRLFRVQPPPPADTEFVAHRWDAEAWAWIAEATPAARLRQAFDEINHARARAADAPVAFLGRSWQADSTAAAAMAARAAARPFPDPIVWLDAANEPVPLSPEEFLALFSRVIDQRSRAVLAGAEAKAAARDAQQ